MKLREFDGLQAVFVGEELIPGRTPQRIECRACGHAWAVPRGTIWVRKP